MRMQRVLAHIEQNLSNDLSLKTLSDVAAYSQFHFHRQFSASFGLSIHSYVQLGRMKKAAHLLAYRELSITSVAMDVGFGAPDAFARAFRRKFGQSPSEFRKSPDWKCLQSVLQPYDQVQKLFMKTMFAANDVELRTVFDTKIFYMTHKGNPSKIGSTLRRFIAWRKKVGLPPHKNPTYSIFHTDPCSTPASEHREDLCVSINKPIEKQNDEVQLGLIPGGRCAVLRVVGNANSLEPAAFFLYRDWLPASGEDPRDFPIYCQRFSLFPDVPASETITELFLPLK